MGEATWVRTLPDLDGTRVIVCSGELDSATTGPLREALREAQHEADSALLNTLVQAHRRKRLIVVGPCRPQVARLFQVTGTHTLLDPARD
ncbi:STAS domain-containing protein [Streptomyces sp. NPDC060010]|uniref:STAS domain-containing protein n=1 Tax=Streptomyces sp. NPDC060010 TaxID=3347036 RepID=UPI0036833549